jgi:hypothetical protein
MEMTDDEKAARDERGAVRWLIRNRCLAGATAANAEHADHVAAIDHVIARLVELRDAAAEGRAAELLPRKG